MLYDSWGEQIRCVHVLAWAARAEYPRLDGLKQWTFISHISSGWEAEMKVLTDLMSGGSMFPEV